MARIVEIWILRVILPLRDPFAATFNEMRAPTSKKYVTEQGIVMPNWPKNMSNFLVVLLRFLFYKSNVKIEFSECFYL